MTFEEVQEILNGMLRIQQDIQIKQLNNTDAIARIDEQQKINSEAIALLTENISKYYAGGFGYQKEASGNRKAA